MSNLIQPSGTHEVESDASRWAQKFYQAFIRASTELKIKGFDMGENYYQFNHNNQTVTIVFKVK